MRSTLLHLRPPPHPRPSLLRCPPPHLPPLLGPPPGPSGDGGGVAEAAEDAVVALGALVGAVGARPLRLQSLLPLLLLEVRLGHPSPTHGQGVSRCGPSKVREEGLTLHSSRLPCSLVHLCTRRPGLHLLSPASLRRAGGWDQATLSPSAPWN
jgi:hypothetical protein